MFALLYTHIRGLFNLLMMFSICYIYQLLQSNGTLNGNILLYSICKGNVMHYLKNINLQLLVSDI